MSLSFDDYQQWFKTYDELRGLDDAEPTASLSHLMEEVGEIARHVLRLQGHKPLNDRSRENEIEALALELTDAFVFLTKIANAYGIEWENAIQRSITKAETRYPIEEERQAPSSGEQEQND